MRRFLSHILIGMATFVLTATLFVWVLDNRVLDPKTLNAELRKAGVTQEFTALLPEVVTPEESATADEKVEFSDAISRALTVNYVDDKVSGLSTSVLTYVREGEPQPELDLRDFPERIRAEGITPDQEFEDTFAEPIKLNESGDLDKVHDAYEIFSKLTFIGFGIFAVLMLLEWFVAKKGQKLRRLSRVFLYAGLSYAIYWGIIVALPRWGTPLLNNSIQAKYDTTALTQAILKAIEGLFAFYFLSFAAVGIGIAIVLYVIRHFKHGDVMTAQLDNHTKA